MIHKWQSPCMTDRPLTKDFLSAAIGAVGGLLGSGVSYKGQKEANKTNIQLAREQMDFQREMSNTAHQRQIKDLNKAGLNPILSTGGQGASAPTGARATVQNPLQGAGSQILNAAAQVAQVNNLEETNKNIQAQTDKVNQETATARAAEILTYENAKRVSIDNELQEPKKGIYTKGYSLVDNALDAAEKYLPKFKPESKANLHDAVEAPRISPEEMKQIDEAKKKLNPKPQSKKNPFIRPWGEYPSLSDPDFKVKLKWYKAQQKLKGKK